MGKVGKVGKSWKKWGKVGKNGKKWGKVVKSWKKCGTVGKSGERWEKWGKVDKSEEKWGKVGKSGKNVFFNFGQNGRRRPFWMSENNFRSQFLPFQIDTQLFFFNFWTKWPPAAIFDWTTMSVIELVRDIWMNNACVKFEERSLNPSKVIALTTKL